MTISEYLTAPPTCSTEEMDETLAYLASLIPAGAPPIHRERLEAIREQVYRARHLLWCGGPAAPRRLPERLEPLPEPADSDRE
jgi:hypothetical protein